MMAGPDPERVLTWLCEKIRECGDPKANQTEVLVNLRSAIAGAERAAEAAPGTYLSKELVAYAQLGHKELERMARRA